VWVCVCLFVFNLNVVVYELSVGPVWAKAGRCDETNDEYGKISDACRKSCKACTPMAAGAGAVAFSQGNAASSAQKKSNEGGGGGGGNSAVKFKENNENSNFNSGKNPETLPTPPKVPVISERDLEILKVDAMIQAPMTVNPESLHEQYMLGNLPDVIDGSGALVTDQDQCYNMELPDSQLLSRVKLASGDEDTDFSKHVDSDGNPLRIFCGIYTMASSHATNVRATRNTWAKKCDGFIAFSTEEDQDIPSVNILHEGKEAYDNMWQKSRSIWKYIHAHLKDKFDFFLLGGDDMFYIVENLRAYLGSAEITRLRKEGEGIVFSYCYRINFIFIVFIAWFVGYVVYVFDSALFCLICALYA
jgi:hypothetical protein